MEFGITIPTTADCWKIAKRAEELGYTHAWFYDTALVSAEIFVAMGAAALTTSRIKLCAGVLTPSNRIAPVAASGLASLNAMAPGRIIFGIGTGFTGRRTLGRGPVKLRDLETYIRAVEGLLAGRTIDWEMEGTTRKTAFLNPDAGAINIKDPIPTHISAFGPKGRKLTAKLGAGWLNSMSTPDGEAAALAHMRSTWSKAGHATGSLYATLCGGGCVLAEGESADSPRVLAHAGPTAAVAFHSLVEDDSFGEGLGHTDFPFQEELNAYRAVYRSYPSETRYISNHRGHMMFVRPEEKHLTARVVRALTFTGTASELADRLREAKKTGYAQFAVAIVPAYADTLLEQWARVAEKI
jgi:5,10-methylenetetrahydromethanopterin reductase